MTEDDKKKRIDPFAGLDKMTKEDWQKIYKESEEREKAGDAWLKGLIEKGERERAQQGQNGDDVQNSPAP